MSPVPRPDVRPPALRVMGLCAQWCGVCRDFEPSFRQFVQEHPALQGGQAAWLDVEDEAVADALGDLDIETFPSIALGYEDGRLLFLGPILPSVAVLARLMEDAAGMSAVQDAAQQQIWRNLLQLGE